MNAIFLLVFLPGLIIFGLFTLMYISDNIADAIETYSDKRNKANKEIAWDIKFFKEDLEERTY